MDEFELAGFDAETCEKLRKISQESGIEPERLICVIRYGEAEQHTLSEYATIGTAWEEFKQALWDVFEKSRIGKIMIWLADRLNAWLERFRK